MPFFLKNIPDDSRLHFTFRSTPELSISNPVPDSIRDGRLEA